MVALVLIVKVRSTRFDPSPNLGQKLDDLGNRVLIGVLHVASHSCVLWHKI